MKTSLSIRLAPWLATAALFIVWEAVVRIFHIPAFFLPRRPAEKPADAASMMVG